MWPFKKKSKPAQPVRADANKRLLRARGEAFEARARRHKMEQAAMDALRQFKVEARADSLYYYGDPLSLHYSAQAAQQRAATSLVGAGKAANPYIGRLF